MVCVSVKLTVLHQKTNGLEKNSLVFSSPLIGVAKKAPFKTAGSEILIKLLFFSLVGREVSPA